MLYGLVIDEESGWPVVPSSTRVELAEAKERVRSCIVCVDLEEVVTLALVWCTEACLSTSSV